jgi:hypothetical protein
MKELKVKHITAYPEKNYLGMISDLLNTLDKQELDYRPWIEYTYKPAVSFSIAHSSDAILLKFFVQEKQIRANNLQTNSAIWEDSCVEFFISIDEGIHYYNLEYNCIGTGLIGYGQSKDQRELLHPKIVTKVKTMSNIIAGKGKKISWELTLIIPMSVFEKTSLTTLPKINCRANFFKCGDLLAEPHFVSWSNIKSESPNFHLPEYFGRLIFE